MYEQIDRASICPDNVLLNLAATRADKDKRCDAVLAMLLNVPQHNLHDQDCMCDSAASTSCHVQAADNIMMRHKVNTISDARSFMPSMAAHKFAQDLVLPTAERAWSVITVLRAASAPRITACYACQ